MLGRLRELPGTSADAEGPFRIVVRRGGSVPLHVRIDGMYAAHRHGALDPDAAADEIAAAAAVSWAEDVPDSALGDAHVTGPFPRLYRRGALPDLPPAAVLRPCDFDDALVIGYSRLLPHGELPLTIDEVARRWPRTDDLHALALANLDATTEDAPLEGLGWAGHLAMGYNTADGLDAARALLPARLLAAEAWLDGQTLVAVPSRDLLMLFGDADPDFVAQAREHVAEVYATDAHGLSDRLYRLTQFGLEPLES